MFDPIAKMRAMRDNGTAFLSSADDHGRSAPRPAIEWEGPNVRVYKTAKPNSYLINEAEWV